ncbi:MAG: response regulator [Sphingobacteriaceae bacterium]|nr:response regulator [Sphingobacteriaceae bacterium]
MKLRKKINYKHKQVMLVDDNELDNFINEKIIESSEFAEKIYINTSSQSALEFLKNIDLIDLENTNVFPDIIFIDLNMPIIDGFQFIEALNEIESDRVKKCRRVILTSSVHPEDRLKAESISGDILFINKPLTKDILATI